MATKEHHVHIPTHADTAARSLTGHPDCERCDYRQQSPSHRRPRFPITFVFRLAGKLSPEKVLVVERHCERENSGTVTVLAHAHHYAGRAGAKCGMPRSDGQTAW